MLGEGGVVLGVLGGSVDPVDELEADAAELELMAGLAESDLLIGQGFAPLVGQSQLGLGLTVFELGVGGVGLGRRGEQRAHGLQSM